jgi:hypothetical protein
LQRAGGVRGCVAGYGLNRAQAAALIFRGGLAMVASTSAQAQACDWAIADASAVGKALTAGPWRLIASAQRPTDRSDRLLILRRQAKGD